MKFKRRNPLPVEAVQYDGTTESINKIAELHDGGKKFNNIFFWKDSLSMNGKKVKLGNWVVREGDEISAYPSDKFEILFKREMPNFATPTLADIA